MRTDYETLATLLSRELSEHLNTDDVVVLATTRAHSAAQAGALVDKLRAASVPVAQRCRVGHGGETGFNETLRDHLPSRHECVSAPTGHAAAAADDDKPPKPKPTTPAQTAPTWLGSLSNSLSNSLTAAIARVR